jgi:hypothetical protein
VQRNNSGHISGAAVTLENFYSLLPVFVLIGIVWIIVKLVRKAVRGDFKSAPPPEPPLPPPTSGFMRIEIERTVGRLSTSELKMTRLKSPVYHQVLLRMSLSQEALAIINRYDLWSVPILEISPDRLLRELGKVYSEASESNRALFERPIIYTLRSFVENQPFAQTFDTSMEADHFERRLKDEILPTIKHAIESASASGQRKAEPFEL